MLLTNVNVKCHYSSHTHTHTHTFSLTCVCLTSVLRVSCVWSPCVDPRDVSFCSEGVNTITVMSIITLSQPRHWMDVIVNIVRINQFGRLLFNLLLQCFNDTLKSCQHLLTLKLFQTCMSFFFFYWTQKKIFWRMFFTKQLLVAIDFHCIFFSTVNCLVTFFRITSFVFNRRKKLIQVWSIYFYIRLFNWK